MGLTLTQLSNASGVSPSHIGRIERGSRLPSGYVLKALAGALGVNEVGLFKVAGLLPKDAADDRAKRLLKEVEREIRGVLLSLEKKIDNL